MSEKGTTIKYKNEIIHSMENDGEIRLLTKGRYMEENVDIAVNRNLDDEDEGKVVSGGALVAQTRITVTENDTYDTTTNDEVVVEVENSYSASDEGKVVDDGALVAQGSLTITENGTYDTTLISELTANIAGGGGGGSVVTTVEMENGGFDTNGKNASASNRIRSVGFTPCSSDKLYVVKATPQSGVSVKTSVSFYADDDYTINRLSSLGFISNSALGFVPPSNANYFRVLIGKPNDASMTIADIKSCESIEVNENT